MMKRLLLAAITACMNSCGDTWPLNARGFHTLRTSSPKRCTSSDWHPV
jgi:hypothetical protein